MKLHPSANLDFSVIIPTYNRSEFLKKTLPSVLRQKGVRFEIIIGDNYSTDDTAKVIKEFEDKRIKYFKNKKNLGFPANIKKLFDRSKGRYVFALGDDDFILDEHTLRYCLKVMKKYKTGMGSLGSIYFTHSPQSPCKTFIMSDDFVLLKPTKDKSLKLKALDFNYSFFSGLIFDNKIIHKEKLTDNFNYAYFPLVLDAIQRAGIVYIPKLFIVGRISLRFVPQYYSLERLGRFYINDYLAIMQNFLSPENFNRHKKEFLEGSTVLLPSIKLFTNNKNYIKVLQRFVNLEKSLLINPKFIIFAIVGFLPKIILRVLRNLFIYLSERKVKILVKKYNYYEKIQKLVLN